MLELYIVKAGIPAKQSAACAAVLEAMASEWRNHEKEVREAERYAKAAKRAVGRRELPVEHLGSGDYRCDTHSVAGSVEPGVADERPTGGPDHPSGGRELHDAGDGSSRRQLELGFAGGGRDVDARGDHIGGQRQANSVAASVRGDERDLGYMEAAGHAGESQLRGVPVPFGPGDPGHQPQGEGRAREGALPGRLRGRGYGVDGDLEYEHEGAVQAERAAIAASGDFLEDEIDFPW